mmetsp:Transcript_15710/g.23916  ORF Transcript_15710/g.23916 Transcript_15710/m.23916 type:complete len:261 (+) Transcript_15710:1-783(+)
MTMTVGSPHLRRSPQHSGTGRGPYSRLGQKDLSHRSTGNNSPVGIPLLILCLLCLTSIGPCGAETFPWPEASIGQRTSDRVSAGKRAAKYIACEVCEERSLSLFPNTGDVDEIGAFMDVEHFSDKLSDAKTLCGMRSLAKLFKGRKMEVQTFADGTARLSKLDLDAPAPFYEEINTSDLAFHWQSYAVQHACTEIFRRDGEELAKAIEANFYKFDNTDPRRLPKPEEVRQRISKAVSVSCRTARLCKEADKLRHKGHDEL